MALNLPDNINTHRSIVLDILSERSNVVHINHPHYLGEVMVTGLMLVDIFGREVFATDVVAYNGNDVTVRLWTGNLVTEVPRESIRIVLDNKVTL